MQRSRPDPRPDAARSGKTARERTSAALDIGAAVLGLREERNLKGVELCRRARGLDPKTLTAVEKGRIKNPSIATLRALAEGFGITVSELFRRAEILEETHFRLGTQKGMYKMEFPAKGVQLISFTPLAEEFFCGKIILEGERRFDDSLLAHKGALFVMVLVGQVEGEAEGKKVFLREGENLYLRGGIRFHLRNPVQRNASLLLVTAPSCVSSGHPYISFSKY